MLVFLCQGVSIVLCLLLKPAEKDKGGAGAFEAAQARGRWPRRTPSAPGGGLAPASPGTTRRGASSCPSEQLQWDKSPAFLSKAVQVPIQK